jgi:hypothetical protein
MKTANPKLIRIARIVLLSVGILIAALIVADWYASL